MTSQMECIKILLSSRKQTNQTDLQDIESRKSETQTHRDRGGRRGLRTRRGLKHQ